MGEVIKFPSSPEAKEAALAKALSEVRKEYGKGAIFDMADKVGEDVPVIPTGIYDVDNDVLGIGGLPKGRIVEIYGTEGGGKTTLTLTLIASAQRAGGKCLLIDAEHALDPTWAALQGVNVDDLLVAQPDNGEQALAIAEHLISTGSLDLVVVDSVAALVPKAELEGEMGESHVGRQARLMAHGLRKLLAVVMKSGTCLVFINQIREKIGVTQGSPETTPGGRSLKFYASVRLDVRRIGAIKNSKEEVIGNQVKIKTVKNRCFPPFKDTTVELLFDRGFDTVGCLIDKAVELGIIDKSGAWYSWGKDRIGQGRLNSIEFIRENKKEDELLKAIQGKKNNG